MYVLRFICRTLFLPVWTAFMVVLMTANSPLDCSLFWAALEAIGTSAAVIVALVLALREASKERRAREELNKAVRTLLQLEIDQNLEWLHDYWDKLDEQTDSELQSEDYYLELSGRLIDLRMPNWHHNAWQSQMPNLPNALGREKLKEVNTFHYALDTLRRIRANLGELNEKERDALRDLKMQDAVNQMMQREWVIADAGYRQRAPDLWSEFADIVQTLLQKGNPL